MPEQVFNYGPPDTTTNRWFIISGSDTIDDSLVETSGTTLEFMQLTLRRNRTITLTLKFPGGELSHHWEDSETALTISGGGRDFVFPGPNAPSTVTRDRNEPYVWTIPNSFDMPGFLAYMSGLSSAQKNNISIKLSFFLPPTIPDQIIREREGLVLNLDDYEWGQSIDTVYFEFQTSDDRFLTIGMGEDETQRILFGTFETENSPSISKTFAVVTVTAYDAATNNVIIVLTFNVTVKGNNRIIIDKTSDAVQAAEMKIRVGQTVLFDLSPYFIPIDTPGNFTVTYSSGFANSVTVTRDLSNNRVTIRGDAVGQGVITFQYEDTSTGESRYYRRELSLIVAAGGQNTVGDRISPNTLSELVVINPGSQINIDLNVIDWPVDDEGDRINLSYAAVVSSDFASFISATINNGILTISSTGRAGRGKVELTVSVGNDSIAFVAIPVWVYTPDGREPFPERDDSPTVNSPDRISPVKLTDIQDAEADLTGLSESTFFEDTNYAVLEEISGYIVNVEISGNEIVCEFVDEKAFSAVRETLVTDDENWNLPIPRNNQEVILEWVRGNEEEDA